MFGSQIFGSHVQHAKKNGTKSDPKFCENEGSKRSKINEKRGPWIENLYKMLKILNNTFW